MATVLVQKAQLKEILYSTPLFFSNYILEIRGCMASAFSRQPRSFSDLAHWKVTEFRQFILYIGPLVLKGIIEKPIYSLLLSLQ